MVTVTSGSGSGNGGGGGGGGGGEGGGIRRRGCCNKEDFFPEESFKNWGSYMKALGETRMRLKDRFLSRSTEEIEVSEMTKRSQHNMKKNLTWWDLIMFGVGGIFGAGIFVLAGMEARKEAGPAIVISFLVSGISAMLCTLCYAEFAIEIPVAGGSFAYLRVELGDFVAYLAAGNILFEYIVGGASVSRTWTSYFATLCGYKPDDFRIHVPQLNENYSKLDPLAVFISTAVGITASIGTKASSRFNMLAVCTNLSVVVLIIIAGLVHADPKNLEDFAPYGAKGIFAASAVVFFSYQGFDAVATLAEETKNPPKDIPIGLVGSMFFIITTYCVLATTLCLMQSYTEIDPNAAFSMAFQSVGMNWAGRLVALGAVFSMSTNILANMIGQARYFTHIGRTHIVPPWLAIINENRGTPINATVVMTIANCIVGLFTNLNVLSSLLSISTLTIFTSVSLALLVRRHYVSGQTSNTDRNKLIMFLILIFGSSVGIAVYFNVVEDGWIGYIPLVSVWVLSTVGLKVMVKQARQPKTWGVPLVPFIPSASICINVFLLGSLDAASYLRFGVWTLILLAYYFLVGLHASYDSAKMITDNAAEMRNVEAGEVAS